ncbi:hypothetical protein PSTT_13451 [Puccinia striiformis]|uniref:Uncharacterized protein n=1 Tax=Puccinia striiformis TaxID=27350 RepID=A0A2S4URM3_9BASI|nr:hypothetical protein PSTT_13451 [Puccinia striiformis]
MSDKPSPTTVSSKIRLDSTNYFGWIVQMQSRFRRLGCLDVVLGRAVKPEKPEAAADWVDKNEGAYFEIIDHVDVEHMTLIGGAVPPNQQFDGRFVWDLLKSKYAANDDVSKLVALEAFNELEFTTIPAFITTVCQINQRLILANFDLGNQLRNLMVLAKLPRDRFQSFRDIITMGFVAEDFESLLRNRPDQAALLTLSIDQLTCPSCKKSFKICRNTQSTSGNNNTIRANNRSQKPRNTTKKVGTSGKKSRLETHEEVDLDEGTTNNNRNSNRKRKRRDDENNDEEDPNEEGGLAQEEEEEENRNGEDGSNLADSDTIFTLENFESQFSLWLVQKLCEALEKRKASCSNRVPPKVQEALVLLQQNYLKSKLMLSLIGRVSETSTAKFLGENKPPRKKSNWNRFIAFSVASEQTPVPPKGCSDGWDERNTIMGEQWAELLDNEREVFSVKIFQYFSKIPCYFQDEEAEDEEDKTTSISQEQEQLYRLLYKRLVNVGKVESIISQGTVSHNKTGVASKQASTNLQRINSELYTISNFYSSTYYLLISSRSPGVNIFCHEYSNDPGWLAIVKSKWASKETFEAYSQARVIQEVLEKSVGVSIVKKPRSANEVRNKLCAALNQALAIARGMPGKASTCPKTKDPAAGLVKIDPKLQIVQSGDSTLGPESLMKGYTAMIHQGKQKWLQDIQSSAFKIQLIQ